MVPLPVLAADAGVIEVYDTTRVGVRSTQPLQFTQSPPYDAGRIVLAGDASTAPEVRMSVTDRHWMLHLDYTVNVTETDFELRPLPPPNAVQTASAAVGWHDRFWTFNLSESGSYAANLNTAYLFYGQPVENNASATGQTGSSQTPTTGGQPTQQPTTGGQGGSPTTTTGAQTSAAQARLKPGDITEYASSSTDASIATRIGRTTVLAIDGGYQLTGGLTTQSKLLYPEEYGAYVGLALQSRVGRSDTLGFGVSASETYSTELCFDFGTTVPQYDPKTGLPNECHEVVPVAGAQATFAHQLARRSSLSLALGVSVGADDTETLTLQRKQLAILPTGSVGYTAGLWSHNSQLVATAQVSPTVDFLTGDLAYRLSLALSVVDQLAPWLLVGASASYIQSLPIPGASYQELAPLTSVGAELDVRIRLDRRADLILSTQDFWQKQSGYGTLASELAYVGLTVHTLPLRF